MPFVSESITMDHANCGIGELALGQPWELPGRDMESMVRYVTAAAALAVLVVLLAGLWNMMRGSSPNLSQTLMRWRVGLQFLAILVTMTLLYFLRH
jgi:hypothetical protein